jgi:hypothetical protein
MIAFTITIITRKKKNLQIRSLNKNHSKFNEIPKSDYSLRDENNEYTSTAKTISLNNLICCSKLRVMCRFLNENIFIISLFDYRNFHM